MTIVVGYLPTPEGSAAVDHAIAEATLTSARVVVVNTGHYGDFSHPTSPPRRTWARWTSS